MLPMTFAAAFSSSGPSRSRILGLLAALLTAVAPALALADTGGPSPQGYTDDVADSPRAQDGDPADEYADDDPSALTDFHDTLDAHGAWTEDPTYGTIWVPDGNEVGADFAPYQTAGHWAVADSGDWMWESDYDWGYVPFHYGRWVWAGSYWGWIPGRVYAPAWVTWRVGDDGYLGWAPLPPSWYWANGVAVGLWTIPYAAYCFVPTTHVFHNHVSTYVVRDRGVVNRAAAGTRPYTPARPSVGHTGVGGHKPRHRAPSPSFSAARIPASAIPQRRVSADRRAMGYATRSATTATRRAPGRASLRNVPPRASGASAWHNTYDGYSRGASPAGRTPGSPRQQGAARAAAPPSHRSASSFGAPASGRVAPSFHRTPGFRSGSPGFRSPSGRAPSLTKPKHVSRPSAPRFSGARGGRRR